MRTIIPSLVRYRCRTLLALLYALGMAIGAAPVAFAQRGDVINTGGNPNDPNADGCVEGLPHPQYGAPDRWPVNDPTWKEMANDAYYALCVGSCNGQSAYCYKNPYYGTDSYETKWDPERDADPPLVMEDGTPVELAFPSATSPMEPSPPADVIMTEGSECTSEEAPPVCIAQAPPARDPFILGAEKKVERSENAPPPLVPGTSVKVEGKDPRGGKVVVIVEIADNGGAPTEPGLEVDWEKWYHDWIQTVITKVHGPLKDKYSRDGRMMWIDVWYTVNPDGTIHWEYPGSYSSAGQNDFAVFANQRYLGLKAPPFPKGSKRLSVTRKIKFNHNVPDALGEFSLYGPPNEPKPGQ